MLKLMLWAVYQAYVFLFSYLLYFIFSQREVSIHLAVDVLRPLLFELQSDH